MVSPKAVGSNLRSARKSLGMTQEEASSALGISRSAISLIESGKRQVNSSELARFASLYHKTISELLDPEAIWKAYRNSWSFIRASPGAIDNETICQRVVERDDRERLLVQRRHPVLNSIDAEVLHFYRCSRK
jgi:transcriptional regulator with XRE-family HTH domain